MISWMGLEKSSIACADFRHPRIFPATPSNELVDKEATEGDCTVSAIMPAYDEADRMNTAIAFMSVFNVIPARVSAANGDPECIRR